VLTSWLWMSERFELEVGDRLTGARWEEPSGSWGVFVLAHGAGAGMDHPFLVGTTEGLVSEGLACLRFEFPYVHAGRRSPDPPAVLLRTWRAACAEGASRAAGSPLAAGGKSMGGRIASMLAAEEGEAFPAAALVFFGYPLHPPGRPEKLRDAHLGGILRPMLFIQGTNDALATFGLISSVVAKLGPRARLHAVEGGDHSFRVRGAKRSDAEIGRDLGVLAAGFVRAVAG
jgi:predicted alpha/beta-hydrolase family hydrolase